MLNLSTVYRPLNNVTIEMSQHRHAAEDTALAALALLRSHADNPDAGGGDGCAAAFCGPVGAVTGVVVGAAKAVSHCCCSVISWRMFRRLESCPYGGEKTPRPAK